MRQQSTKIWSLKDGSEHWFSVAEALAEGYKREDLEKFDSQSEFVRFKDLLILQGLGEIRDLQCHPKFRISQRFDRHYSPDFIYRRIIEINPNDSLDKNLQTNQELIRLARIGIEVTKITANTYWVLVAEDVKGVSRKKTAKGYKPAYLLRKEHDHIFERFQEQNPQYLFELYPPLE